MESYLPIAALLVDRLLGDPRSSLHPVVLIGRYIAWLEKKLRNPLHTAFRQQSLGFLLVLAVLLTVYGVVWSGLLLAQQTANWLYATLAIVLLSFTISPRSLAEAGEEIYRYLLAGDMTQARFKVGWIVGRDTANLDTPEVTRATVETVAENIVDGIISPLFYFALGGVPLAFLYRAVNTMDSMLGYKNEKYLYFGRAAARIDDLFNYVPARLTGLLIILAAWLLRFDAARAWHMIKRDARKHPSPNSGYAEAGVAGALGVQLGGLNYYGGIASQRAKMGDSLSTLAPEHITQTIRIMYTVTILFVILLAGATRLIC